MRKYTYETPDMEIMVVEYQDVVTASSGLIIGGPEDEGKEDW